MLNLHTSVPDQYRSLLPFLLTPAGWQQKGSIPGLVKLLRAFLARDAGQMVVAGQVASVLAVAQQRLIPSKVNDSWGFELLHGVVATVKPSVFSFWSFLVIWVYEESFFLIRDALKPYFKPVIMALLTRMHQNKTDKFVYLFTKFLLFMMAIDVEGLNPDYVIATVEEIQPQ